MYQINNATPCILGTKTKNSGRKFRWFEKAHHKLRSLNEQEGPQTLKGSIIQYVAQRNNYSSIPKHKLLQ